MAGSDLTTALLKQVSRSFYLSVAVLPAAVRPTIGLAYLFARAADTIADTRLIERRARIVHLEALGEELTPGAGGPPRRHRPGRGGLAVAARRAPAARAPARDLRGLSGARRGRSGARATAPRHHHRGHDGGPARLSRRGRGQARRARDARRPRPVHLPGGGLRGRVLDRGAHGSPAPPRPLGWPGDAGARRAIRPGAPAHERPARRPARPAHRPLLSAARGPGAPRPRAGRSARSRRRARRAPAAAGAARDRPRPLRRGVAVHLSPSRARRRGCDWPAPGRS